MKIKDGILIKVEEKDIKGGHLTIPPKVKGIGPKACYDLRSLRYVHIPKSVVIIFESAFESSNLKEVELPNYVAIKDRAFAHCRELKKFKADKITSIPKSCLESCFNLEEVKLGEGLVEIGNNAFSSCHSLKEIVLPDSVEVIGDFAFSNCMDLNHIEFSESLQEIGDYAFAGCNLSKYEYKDGKFVCETIELPENLVYIGKGAFASGFAVCNDASFVIPKYCSFIGRDAFERGGNKGKGESNRINKIEFNEDGTATVSMEHGEDIWVDEINPQAIPVINKHPELKEKLLKDMKDPKLARVYAALNFWLTKEKFEDFYANKNMKFFKQISDYFYLGNDDIFTLLYNLGAFSKPVETTSTTKSGKEVTKTIDYAQKVCGLFVDDERLLKLFSYNGELYRFAEMGFKGFNQEFADFFLDKTNLTQLLEEEKQNPGFIARCFNEFEQFQAQNTSNKGSQRQLKPTVEKFKVYFAREKLAGVPEEQRNLVLKVEQYLPLKKSIKRAIKIDAERKRKKTPDHLVKGGVNQQEIMAHIDEMSEDIKSLSVSTLRDLKKIADNGFTFEFLSKSDPANFILGKLCNCCAHLEGAGYGIMHASIVSPHVQNLVIRDRNGTIVAKSTLYINPRRGYGVFNNVEIAEGYENRDVELLKIYKTYKAAIETFAEKYNAEHPKEPIKIITVGMKHNDLIDEIANNRPRAKGKDKKKAVSYARFGRYQHRYAGDSAITQRIMWELGVEDEQSID